MSAEDKELTDNVVTLAPYFKIKDMDKFKSIWQENYKKFAHKKDCVHYAFCFTDDDRAHCREAYLNADKVLQHLADVRKPFKAALDGPAELERMEVHGPKIEIDKLRDALSPLGCLFYVTEWGNRRAKPAMENDTVCHLYPYFKLNQPEEFRQIWYDAFPATKSNQEAEKSHQYSFSFEPTADVASCRESYADADGVLLHLSNVAIPLKAALNGPSELLRIEVHAPASEIEILKPALEPLGCHFFATEWGFRNAVGSSIPEVPSSSKWFWARWKDQRVAKNGKAAIQMAATVMQAAKEENAVNNAAQTEERVSAAAAPAAEAAAAKAKDLVAKELTDSVITLAPYFKVKSDKDMDTFKSIWQDAYKDFAHKEDCVHYAFCFTDDNRRAHCREAYPDAEKVLQHLADVDAPLKAVLNGVAELERLEVHGPEAEIDKLRDALSPLGCLFYITEWGNRRAKTAMESDTVCHLYPYFKLKQADKFRQIWYDAFPSIKANQKAERSRQYAFSFEPTADVASCRESYSDAESVMLHLSNVAGPLKAALNGPSELLRMEVHAPASEIEILKPELEPLGCQFFTTEWGFRNAVEPPHSEKWFWARWKAEKAAKREAAAAAAKETSRKEEGPLIEWQEGPVDITAPTTSVTTKAENTVPEKPVVADVSAPVADNTSMAPSRGSSSQASSSEAQTKAAEKPAVAEARVEAALKPQTQAPKPQAQAPKRQAEAQAPKPQTQAPKPQTQAPKLQAPKPEAPKPQTQAPEGVTKEEPSDRKVMPDTSVTASDYVEQDVVVNQAAEEALVKMQQYMKAVTPRPQDLEPPVKDKLEDVQNCAALGVKEGTTTEVQCSTEEQVQPTIADEDWESQCRNIEKKRQAEENRQVVEPRVQEIEQILLKQASAKAFEKPKEQGAAALLKGLRSGEVSKIVDAMENEADKPEVSPAATQDAPADEALVSTRTHEEATTSALPGSYVLRPCDAQLFMGAGGQVEEASGAEPAASAQFAEDLEESAPATMAEPVEVKTVEPGVPVWSDLCESAGQSKSASGKPPRIRGPPKLGGPRRSSGSAACLPRQDALPQQALESPDRLSPTYSYTPGDARLGIGPSFDGGSEGLRSLRLPRCNSAPRFQSSNSVQFPLSGSIQVPLRKGSFKEAAYAAAMSPTYVNEEQMGNAGRLLMNFALED